MAGKQYQIQIKIDGDGKAAVTAINGVNRSLDGNTRKTKEAADESSRLGTAFGRLSSSAAALLGVGGLAGISLEMLKISERAALLDRGFLAVTGSASLAASELEYLYQVSDRLGVNALETGKIFLGLTAAVKGTSLEGEQARDIFEVVSLSMAKLGKTSDDTSGALYAIQQMISKGRVSAEELSGQLGERLPGALRIASEAMGMTTQELYKMMENGDLMAEDLLPKLIARLRELYDDGKEVTGLTAEWNRFTNQMREFATEAVKVSGAVGLIETALRGAVGIMDDYRWFFEMIRTGVNPDKSVAAIEAQALGYEMLRQEADTTYAKIIEKQAEVARLAKESSGLIGSLVAGPELARSQGELLALAQHLGEVKQRLAEIDEQQERTWARADEGAAAASGWSQAMVEATAQTLGWSSGVDSAVSRLQKAEPILKDAAKAAKIPEEVLLSVFAMENAFGRTATSIAGAKGPMQFMDATAAGVAKQMNAAGVATGMTAEKIQTDLTAALQAGAFHLADLAGQFDHFYQALIAYNAGPGKADLPFAQLTKETQDYVRNGIALMEQYAAATGNLGAISDEVAAAQKYMAGEVVGAGDAMRKSSTQVEQAQAAASKAVSDALESAQRLTREYIPGRAAALDYAEAQHVLAVAVAAGTVSQKEATEILGKMSSAQAETADVATEKADVFAVVWENAVERIDDGFASLWEDLFTGSTNAMDAIKTGLKRWLAEVAHMLTTQRLTLAIGASVAGGSAAASATGQAASTGLGGAQSVGYLGKISGLLSSNSIGEGVASALGKTFGQIGSVGESGWFNQGLSNLSGTSNLTLGASTLGGGLAGGLVASQMFEGEYVGIGSTIGSAVGATAAPLIAAAIGAGPVGWAALAGGAFLGAIGGGGLGSLFGGEKEAPKITLEVTGGDFRVQSTNGQWSVVDGGGGATTSALNQLNDEMQALARDLGPGAEAALAAFQHTGQVLSAENFQQWVDDVSAGMVRAMASGVRDDAIAQAGSGVLAGIMTDALSQVGDDPQAMLAAVAGAKRLEAALIATTENIFNAVGASVFDTADMDLVSTRIYQLAHATMGAAEGIEGAMMRVMAGVDAGATALKLVGDEMSGLSVQAVYDVGAALADAAGGYETLAAGMARYYELFFTEEERRADQIEAAQRQTSRALEELGLAMPQSADGFRDLIESLDLTSTSGQETFATLTGLSEQFHLLYEELEQTGTEVVDLGDQFLGLRSSLRELADDLDPQTSSESRAQAETALADAGYTGAFESEAIAEFLRALAEVDNAGGEAAEGLLAVSDALRSALDEAARVADERSGLDLRLLKLTASETDYLAEVRRRELEGLDASNRAIQERIYALEDAAKAEEDAERIAQESADIKIRLLEAQGLSEEALAMRRAQELDAVDESNRAMLLRIYMLEDEQAALDELSKAANDAYATLQRSVDAEKEAINASYDAQLKALDAQQKAAQEAHEAQMEALQAQRDASAESLQEIESLLSTIQSAIDGFKLEGIDEGAKAFSESMAELQRMARSPLLPDQEALDAAVGGLSGFSPDDYATRAEYEADYYATMTALEDLEKRLGTQKTIEEQMLESLDAQIDAADAQYEAQMAAFDAQREALAAWRDDQIEALDALLEEAQAQLDVLNGVNTTILSVEEALIQFAEAVGAYNAANSAVNDASLAQLERSADMLEQIAEPGGAMHVPADPDLAQDTSEIADLLRRILESSQSLEAQGSEQTVHVRDIASMTTRWDIDGLPNERDSAYLEVI